MIRSVRNAAALLFRHQRLIWWIFLVNLVLAFLSSLPARMSLASSLDHSLESLRFVNGFDVTALTLLMGRPSFPAGALAMASLAAAAVYFIYLLFLDGGVFAVYLDDRKLSRGEFFENCGLYLWRMVRLVLYSLVPFLLVAALAGPLGSLTEKLADRSPAERFGFYLSLGCDLIFVLLFLFVRMWFDLAQAEVVAANERRVLRTALRGFLLALRSGGLYCSYLGIAVFSFAVSFVLGAFWFNLPHRATFLSFVTLELVTLIFIASRLWMKAASARRVALLFFAAPEAAAVIPAAPESPASGLVEAAPVNPEPRAQNEPYSEASAPVAPEAPAQPPESSDPKTPE